MHWKSIAGILLVASLLVVTGSYAQDQVNAEFDAGFAGNVPHGNGIIPVSVTLRNTLQNATGVIVVSQSGDVGQSEVSHRLPFTSPANSTKRFTLYIRKQDNNPLRVRILFDELSPITEEIPITNQRKGMILCLGTTPQVVQQLGRPINSAYALRAVNDAQLPDNPLGLDLVHAVIATSAALTEMSDAHLRMLRDWMVTGGRLVVLDPVADAMFQSKLQTLALPAQADVSRAGVYHAGAGYFASGGFGATPGPFWSRGNTLIASYGATLFPHALEKEDIDMTHYGSRGMFSSLTKKQGSYGLSGFLWLALIIVAYVLVIGPLDYYICKKTGKPYLTWPIFLAAIAIFSMVAYWYSTIVHSGSMEAIYVNIIDAAEGQTLVRGNSTFWLYSTKNDTYNLEAPYPTTSFSARESGLSTGVANVDILHDTEPLMQAKIPIFSSKVFDASWYHDLPAGIAVDEVGGNTFNLTLPDGLHARLVYMVTREGVRVADRSADDGAWQLRNLVPWFYFLRGATGEFDFYGGGFRPGVSGLEELPSQRQLATYALWLSFAHVAKEAKDEDEDAEPEQPADSSQASPFFIGTPYGGNPFADLIMRMDERERHLNALHRLGADGRMLVIFLEEDADLFPLDYTIFKVVSRTCNMVRLQLPPRP